MSVDRRTFLQMGAGALLVSAAHGCTTASSSQSGAQTTTSAANSSSGASAKAIKITIGYWPIAAGLPLYLAAEKGYFKEAGLDVEAAKFAGAQQVVEGLIAGRVQGSANGTGSGNLALGEILQPGLFKVIATNPSNADYVLDQVIVAKDSPIQSIAELQGKKVASGPGAQNQALAKGILEKNGIQNPQVTPLDIKQHVAAIASGQIDAAYTLEPTGTIGSLKGITRTLESGVIAKYILGSPKAAWHGGSATLSTQFLNENPEAAKKYIAVYRRGIEDIRSNPEEARQYLAGYTAIEGELTKAVPLPNYMLYDEFTPSDIEYFQSFFDYLQEKAVFSRKVDVAALLYKE
ncbi:ABC transporter substrate-binding protein [Leptolyngbya sp. FACHB-261]|uniref:ABC transporter substrate-binding protein n=1 Tax=Leptolyngbya sp. FACHB-261 TaxID=2692806 RepID=UPI0016850884|nr:ABC transporter substrate-binding protein [Leptolyngbya sp. FACHB-261]MBD2103031.1 ABC transporter substrate-binding protein [Leptolyngbya sp. FACHB-261]